MTHELPAGVPGPGVIFADKCRIEGVLGVGGMAVVLAAHHLHLDQRVAVKLLLPELARNPDIVARFVREGQAAVKIKSEHIVRVSDVAKLDTGEAYMIMEYLDGEDVARLIARSPRLPVAHAVDIVLEACAALAEAHAIGIIHRDLKPANLFLARTPEGAEILKVLDFGISKVLGGLDPDKLALTSTSALIGTPHYMSPEQLSAARDVDARSDIWSLGVAMYELLAGAVPFAGSTIAEIGASVFTRSPTPLGAMRSDVPPAVANAIMGCLEKDIARRPTSVAELATELAPFGTERARRALERVVVFAPRLPPPRVVVAPTIAHASAVAPPIASDPRRSTAWIVVAALGIGGLVGLGALAVVKMRAKRAEAHPVTVVLAAPPPSEVASASSVPGPSVPVPTASIDPTPSAAPHTTKSSKPGVHPPVRPSASPSATPSAPPSSDRFN